MAELVPMRAEPDAATLAKAAEALGYRKQELIAAAPRMPAGFFGEVRFFYANGAFTIAEVVERIKP